MKKAWIFVIAVALLAFSVPLFADGPTVSFSMSPGVWLANLDPTLNNKTLNSGSDRVWPTMDVKMDANNTFEVGIRMTDNTTYLGANNQNIGPGGFGTFGNTLLENSSLWHFMWTSDLTKSAGWGDLPVDVTVTVGLLDATFTNWWYDNNGWEWEYGGPSKTPGSNFNTLGAEMTMINGDGSFMGYWLKVGIGPVTIHLANDFSFENTLIGLEFEGTKDTLPGLGIFASYGYYGNTYTPGPNVGSYIAPTSTASAYTANAGQGNIAIEAKYDVPQVSGWTFKPSAFFRDGLFYNDWVLGADVTIQYNIAFVVVGATTTNLNALEHYSGVFHLLPMGGTPSKSPADVWIGAYLDGATPDSAPLQAVDIGGSYQFGTFRLIVGYVIAGKDQNTYTGTPGSGYNGTNANANAGNNVTILNDYMNGRVSDGLYFGTFINF